MYVNFTRMLTPALIILVTTTLPLCAPTDAIDIKMAGTGVTTRFRSMSGDIRFAMMPTKMVIGTAIETVGSMVVARITNAQDRVTIFISPLSMLLWGQQRCIIGQQGVKQGFFADGLASRPGLHDAVREINNYLEKNTPTRDGRHK